jgi:flavin-dependent thymidylate synthase
MGVNDDGSFKPGPAHGSVVEHPCWSFLVVGAGRGFSHEQVRHRTGWAYSQISTRYCDFEREEEEGTWEPGFCVPPMAQLSDQSHQAFADKLRQSQQAYCQILESIMNDLQNNEAFMRTLSSYDEREKSRMLRKAARGAARDILPIATEAIMVMSANARAIWNCIVLRGNEHAEAAIREIYVQISRIMEGEMPSLFRNIRYESCWDGTDVVIMPRDKL